MNDHIWTTEQALHTTTARMNNYLEYEMNCSCLVTFREGGYAEIMTALGDCYAVHASGNGDFFNHRVSFKSIWEY